LESQFCPLIDDEFNWTIDIDDTSPIQPNSTKGSDDIINIVQITDIHYDPNYESYGNSDCGEPTCCRRGQNNTNVSGKLAGYWGDYNSCDSPWHAVVDALDHIKATHEVSKTEKFIILIKIHAVLIINIFAEYFLRLFHW